MRARRQPQPLGSDVRGNARVLRRESYPRCRPRQVPGWLPVQASAWRFQRADEGPKRGAVWLSAWPQASV
jgi:hypothetical protein